MNIFELTSEIATVNTDLFATEEEIEKRLQVLKGYHLLYIIRVLL